MKLNDIEAFIKGIIDKIKIVSNAKIVQNKAKSIITINKECHNYNPNRLIAIGASTGGTEAIHKILKDMPPTVPGMVIVQHIPPVFSKMFAERLTIQLILM